MATPSNLPRVTYTNATADFTPLHDMLDKAIPEFRSKLGATHPNFIGGKEDSDGKPYKVVSPIDSQIEIGTFIAGTADSVTRAVAAARKALPAWADIPWEKRNAMMKRMADALARRKYDLGIAAMIEVGKSRLEGIGEAEEAVDLCSYYVEEMERNKGFIIPLKRSHPNEVTRSVLRPLGVFGVISPFNFPVALSTNMVSCALVAGNTVVFHPTTNGALTGSMIVECAREAGLPDGVINIINGPGIGSKIVDAEGIDGIAFTGSYGVGMGIYRKYANGPYVRPVIAEMGGKNPAYVSEHADLDAAAEGVMRSAFGLSGEKCSACSAVYVDKKVHKEFVDLLAAKTKKLKVGDPQERDVFMGPVVEKGSYEVFAKAAEDAKKDGGKIVTGGERLKGGMFDRGYYCQPTVVDGLPRGHRLFSDELFAPFIAVQAFSDGLAAAIDEGNKVVYGLTAGVFSKKPEEVELFLNKAQAGTLYANRRANATAGAWPGYQAFGGWKGSGTTGKNGLGPRYLPLYMREQSHTIDG